MVRERCVTVERGEDGVMSYSNSTLTAQPRWVIRDCIIVFGLLRVTSYRRQQAVQPEGYSLDKLRMC